MTELHAAVPKQEISDRGHPLDAWTVTGTTRVWFGQQGERPARDEAARLNQAAAAERRRQREGG